MLKSVFIQNVRNIRNLELELFDGFNWFIGDNGAGKTSILEAISLLLTTKSFRTHKPKVYITANESHALVRGQLIGSEGQRTKNIIAISKSRTGDTIYRNNSETTNASNLLYLSEPLQAIAPELTNLVDANAQERRKFIDWGVFHVKHDFLALWRKFNRSLKQRNTALKHKNVDKLLIKSIDQQWLILGKSVHDYRHLYWGSFSDFLLQGPIDNLKEILGDISSNDADFKRINLSYRQGWAADKTLEEAIEGSFESDSKLGFTQIGPQKSDFQITFDNIPAVDILSRGQKKILQVWLKLMQSAHLYEASGRKSIFLVDDVSAELDDRRADWVYGQINQYSDQVFGTATTITPSLQAYATSEKNMFHVKHGQIFPFKS